MQKLRITLFGPLTIATEDGTPLPLGGKKTNALLAYLAAAPGRAFRREALAELLWPERFEKQSQQSFRQALSSARKILSDQAGVLHDADGGAIALSAEYLSTDLAEFERLAASPHINDRKFARDLYTGDFLATLGAISEEYDQWVLQTRAHLKSMALNLFEEIAIADQQAGQTDEAIDTARRMVEIDPAHEEGHRILMRLYLATGQRSAAFRQYEACRLALAQQLDAEPSAETEALLAAIKTEGEVPAPSNQEGPAQPASPAPDKARTPASAPRMRLSRVAVILALTALIGFTFAGLKAWFAAPAGNDNTNTSSLLTAAPLTCDAPRQAADANKPVLLLLPTRVFGDNKDLQLFGQSTTEAIQSMSSALTDLTLVAGPQLGHPDRDLSPTELAAKNAATQIFETTIRPETGQHRITMRIIDGATGQQLWQSTFTQKDLMANAGHIQNEIAMRAAWGIQAEITEGTQALFHRQYEPESFEVFEHVTRGFGYLAEIQPVYNDLARKEFLAALELDANNPSAHAGLGFTYLSPLLFHWQTGAPGNLESAQRQADLAANLDPSYAPAQNLQALLLLYQGDVAAARDKIDKGLLLSGAGADSTAFGGYVYSYTDNPRRALELATRALVLRPYSTPTWYHWSYARALRVSGDPQAAVNCLKQIDYEEVGTISPALEMVMALFALGRHEEASDYVEMVRDRTDGQFSASQYCASPAHASDAAMLDCRKVLEEAGLP